MIAACHASVWISQATEADLAALAKRRVQINEELADFKKAGASGSSIPFLISFPSFGSVALLTPPTFAGLLFWLPVLLLRRARLLYLLSCLLLGLVHVRRLVSPKNSVFLLRCSTRNLIVSIESAQR